MKKLIYLFFIFPLFLNAQISNFSYDRNILTASWKSGPLICKNNNLFLWQLSFINKYNIDDNGNITFDQGVKNQSLPYMPFPFIIGDSLYTSENSFLMYPDNFYFKVFNISNNNLICTDSLSFGTRIYRYYGNNDYIFINTESSYTNTRVYNRNNLNYISQIPTGTNFAIKDTLLFVEMVQNDHSALSLKSINDINNIYELSFIETGNYEANYNYYFYNNLLFIEQEDEILIIDFSNPHNMQLVSTMRNVPYLDDIRFSLSIFVWNDYLILGKDNKIWIYDISNISNPVLLNIFTDNRLQSKYGNGFTKNTDYIYYAGNLNEVFKINPNSLPDIDILNSYEVGYKFFVNNVEEDNNLLLTKKDLDYNILLSFDINHSSAPNILYQSQNYVLFHILNNLFLGNNFFNNSSFAHKKSAL